MLSHLSPLNKYMLTLVSRSGQKVVEKEFMYPVKFFMG